MMTTRVGVGVALMAGTLLACGTNVSGGTPAPAAAITREQATAAMLSIHVVAYQHANLLTLTPEQLGLPPLSVAVQTLADDKDALAPARRRRAVAKLAAYGGKDTALTDAWRQLLVDRPDAAPSVTQVVADAGAAPPADVESKVFHVLGGPTSCPKEATFFGPLLYDTGAVSVRIEVTVADTIEHVARKIDPQNWDVCGNGYFKQAFLTTNTPSPTSTCPFPAGFPDPTENDARPAGSEYHATLFEDFDCPACGSTRSKNLLVVDTVANKPPCGAGNACSPLTPGNPVPYEACFTIVGGKSLGSCVGKTLVHLSGDHGSLTACNGATAGDVVVSSRKEIAFQENMASGATWAMLWLARAEATQMLADIVCCSSVP